jgi:tripartite-type tricarboxylate transporter receptor subunit TctC
MKKILLLTIMLFHSALYAITIEIVAPFGPGGPGSLIARSVQEAFNDTAYIVVHKPGGSSQVALRHVHKENAVMVFASIMSFVSIDKMNTDVKKIVTEDLEIIASIGIMPMVLFCNAETGIKNFIDLQNNKKPLSFGSVGVGTGDHYTTQLIINKLPKNDHIIVQYPTGGGKPLFDLLGNQINCMWVQYAVHRQHLTNPKLNAIMVTNPISENVPLWDTQFKEKFPLSNIMGLVISKNLSVEVREKILFDIRNKFDASFEKKIKGLGITPYIRYGNDTQIIQEFNKNTLEYLIKNNLIDKEKIK